MDHEAEDMICIMQKLLRQDDALTAWYLQSQFSRIYNELPADSKHRETMAAIWKELMMKWH